jgi:hypothetical protein
MRDCIRAADREPAGKPELRLIVQPSWWGAALAYLRTRAGFVYFDPSELAMAIRSRWTVRTMFKFNRGFCCADHCRHESTD